MPSFLHHLTRTARAALAVATLAAAAMPLAQAAAVSGQGTWETTLQGRDLDGSLANGYEAYYDTDLKITWLADASYSRESGYEEAYPMYWGGAKGWAEQLNVNGITGWRLPDVKPVNGSSFDYSFSFDGSTDEAFNITSTQSELAHLYHVTLGNKSYFDASGNYQPDVGLQNSGPFNHVSFGGYWSGEDWRGPDVDAPPSAWQFDIYNGRQHAQDSTTYGYAWAVRSGDVAAVPEPQTYALVLAGLAAALVARKRRA